MLYTANVLPVQLLKKSIKLEVSEKKLGKRNLN